MLTAFAAALSALNAQTTGVNVVGNNLANLSTTGFKASSTQFSDLFYQSMGSNTQIGLGASTPTTRTNFSQGAIQGSTSKTDVAINGNGFLVAKTASGATVYTRAGNLKVDKSGNLLTNSGEFIQGTDGGNITMPPGTLRSATATSNFSAGLNLDATTPIVTTADAPSASLPITVYGSQGVTHTVTIDYWKTANGTFTWRPRVPASDLTGSGAVTGGGTLTFNAAGEMTAPAANPTINITGLASGESNMALTWGIYDNQGDPTVTSQALPSAASTIIKNGNAASAFDHLEIGEDGIVIAAFADGTKEQINQLQMANFSNPETLTAIGNNNFQTSINTSDPVFGAPNTGGRGKVQGSSLESSTVDIATEFTNLMIYQRGYQANSKVVTTADQINQITVELIR